MTNIDALKKWFAQPVFSKKKTFPRYQHLQGNQKYIFNIPGIDPTKLRVVNLNRNIFLFNEKDILGKITTYDQIDPNELKATYQFGRATILITPNMEKFKEYETKIEIN